MGFKMNGSPAKLGSISGTSGYRSALKMKTEADAAQAESSPAKYGALARPVIGGIVKYGSKIPKYGKKVIDVVGKTVPSSTKAKSIMPKLKTIGKHILGYTALDYGIDYFFGGDDDKKSKTKTTPETTTPKKKSSSGASWTKAVNKNKSTGGGVSLSEYVKRRNSNPKGSAEYNAAQNKINEAYGSSKRYGTSSSSSSSSSSGSSSSSSSSSSGGTLGASSKTTKTRNKIFGGKVKITKSDGQKVKEKYNRQGKLKKTVTKGGGRRTVQDSEGNIIRSRKTRNKKWD